MHIKTDDVNLLREYSGQYHSVFYNATYLVVERALGGIVPSELVDLKQLFERLTADLNHAQPGFSSVDERFIPLLCRILLYQRQRIAEEQERLRARTSHAELRDKIEAKLLPVTKLMGESWFNPNAALAMPRLTDFLTLQDAYAVYPNDIGKVELRFDEKFRILQAPTQFLPHLRTCRLEAWLRNTDLCVAFLDIDDFKSFNTAHTESVVDRELLPRLMRYIEAQVYSHGWAYRQGGDEYIMLLPNMRLEWACKLLADLQHKLFSHGATVIYRPVTVSIGICCIASDSSMTDGEIQDAANKAKEFAKRGGKDCIASCGEDPASLRIESRRSGSPP